MHGAARRYVRDVVQGGLPSGGVVNIGSRNVNGSVRKFFTDRQYVGVDCVDGREVDVVANGATYRPDFQPAVVVTMETLEHTPEAEAICRNAYRMLMPGGVFIVTAAGVGRGPHSAKDGKALRVGEFYANVEEDKLRHWLNEFSDVSIIVNSVDCDIYATAIKGVVQ